MPSNKIMYLNQGAIKQVLRKVVRNRQMRQIIFLLLLIAIMTSAACTASKGSMVIQEDPNGKGFTLDRMSCKIFIESFILNNFYICLLRCSR
jgi:hypothetical protein